MKKLPIFGLNEPKVKEWAIIDDDLYKDLYAYKWIRGKDRRVFRLVDNGKNQGPKKYLGHEILGKTPTSRYVIIHKDGDDNNYCRDNLLAEKRDE